MGEVRAGTRVVVRTAARVAVALASVAVLLVTGYGWSVYRELSTGIVTSDVFPDTLAKGADEPFTALLVGIDSRTDATGRPLTPELLEQLRAGEDQGQLNTDTIILLHVPAGPAARAVAISFPRDSFVEIAGDRGVHKINSAYPRGLADAREQLAAQGVTGPELERRSREAGRRTLVATVQNLAGVPIDHFAEITLAGFVEITEALGGVPVCLNAPVQEPRSGIDLPAGHQVVEGADALAFVRQRRGLSDGDLDRIARQQAFLAGLTSSALSSGTLSDPARVDRLVRAVTRHVVLDRGWDLETLIAQLRRMAGGDITFRTIPTGTPALETPVDGVAVEVDPAEVRRFVRDVVAGRTPVSIQPAGIGAAAAGPEAAPAPPRPEPPITARGVPCVD
jgi:LCP family protein required for cell wall assembly